MPLLEIRDLTKHFFHFSALSMVSLGVEPGELLGIIGPNGSGKSTLFNVLSGIYRVDRGSIGFNGERIERLAPAEIVRRGIARTFQNKRLFGTMTILENVTVAALKGREGSALGDVLGLRRSREAIRAAESFAEQCLARVRLADWKDAPAKDLPYGAQNRLEIARALALEPKLLLLDEPAAGLNPTERSELQELIRGVHHQGVTIALVEHDVRMVTGLCARVVVLDHGEKIADGASSSVVEDPLVLAAYFGGDEHEEGDRAAD